MAAERVICDWIGVMLLLGGRPGFVRFMSSSPACIRTLYVSLKSKHTTWDHQRGRLSAVSYSSCRLLTPHGRPFVGTLL